MKVIKQTGTANTTYYPGRQIKYLAIHYTAGVLGAVYITFPVSSYTEKPG